MGDRRMAEIVTEDGSLYLYTHWSGYVFPEQAARAISSAESRWSDQYYAVRILIDQIFKGLRDEPTGGGIALKPVFEDEYHGDVPSVVIDLKAQTLTVIDDGDGAGTWGPIGTFTFAECAEKWPKLVS